MQALNEFYYSWSPTVADINKDGALDIVAGPYLLPRSRLQRRARDLSRQDDRREHAVLQRRPVHLRLHRRRLAGRHQRALHAADDPLRQPGGPVAALGQLHRHRQPEQRDRPAQGHRRRRQARIHLQGQQQPDRLGDARPGESDRHVGQAAADRARAVDQSRHRHRRRQQGRPRRSAERLWLVGAAGDGNVRAVEVLSRRVRQVVAVQPGRRGDRRL